MAVGRLLVQTVWTYQAPKFSPAGTTSKRRLPARQHADVPSPRHKLRNSREGVVREQGVAPEMFFVRVLAPVA